MLHGDIEGHLERDMKGKEQKTWIADLKDIGVHRTLRRDMVHSMGYTRGNGDIGEYMC